MTRYATTTLLLVALALILLPFAGLPATFPDTFQSWSNTAPTSPTGPVGLADASRCGVPSVYRALTDKEKDTQYAFGNPVKARSRSAVLEAVSDYVYQDSTGANAVASAIAGSYGDLKTNAPKYAVNATLWCHSAQHIMRVLSKAHFTVGTASKGEWSLYLVKAPGVLPVQYQQAQLNTKRPVAVFTWGNHTVSLRLDGHFQPVQRKAFPSSIPFAVSGCSKPVDASCS